MFENNMITIMNEYNAFIIMSGMICILCYQIYKMRNNLYKKNEKYEYDENNDYETTDKKKLKKNTDKKETYEKMYDTIRDLQIKSSMNSAEIHKLYLENYELRGKLDQIYANDLNENINYYKNIVLLNEKIEYMQKRMLHIHHL